MLVLKKTSADGGERMVIDKENCGGFCKRAFVCSRLKCVSRCVPRGFFFFLSLLKASKGNNIQRGTDVYGALDLFLCLSVGRLPFAIGHECDFVKFTVLVICSGF